MKIFKYPITARDTRYLIDYFELELPFGANILTVQVQDDIPCIWCLVEPRNGPEKRKFRLVRTRYLIKDPTHLIYIGTFQLNPDVVYHLFEIHQR